MKINEITESINEMAASTGGLEYESNVVKSVKKALPHFQERVKFTNLNYATAGYSSVGIDLELQVNGVPFNVEIKQNKDAQMGGTSIRYNPSTDLAEIVNRDTIDDEAEPYFLNAIQSKKDAILAFLDYMRKQEPLELHSKIPERFPISGVTKEAWKNAVNDGYLTALNETVKFNDTSIITKAYNLKQVFYIQVGGAGLFYLNENPFGLPIPKFEGQIQIEFRLGRSGSKPRKFGDTTIDTVGAGYRCQGRLKTRIKSSLSLDNSAEAFQIFAYIDDQTKNA
jgi:hypothetical protein